MSDHVTKVLLQDIKEILKEISETLKVVKVEVITPPQKIVSNSEEQFKKTLEAIRKLRESPEEVDTKLSQTPEQIASLLGIKERLVAISKVLGEQEASNTSFDVKNTLNTIDSIIAHNEEEYIGEKNMDSESTEDTKDDICFGELLSGISTLHTVICHSPQFPVEGLKENREQAVSVMMKMLKRLEEKV